MDYTVYGEHASLYTELRPYLHDGEEVLWTGRPYASVPYRPHIGTMLFSLFWLGFAIFWTVGASAADGFFGLFGLPFVGMGFFLLYNVFIGKGRQYEKTVYAVTNRRAIILMHTYRGVECTEFSFANMQNVTMSAVRGSTGSILFPYYYLQTPYNSSHRGRVTIGSPTQSTQPHGFYMIDNVQQVYHLISEQISKASYR